MNNNLLIIGAGQYSYVAKEIAEATERFDKIDFLDDVKEHAIAKTSEYKRLKEKYGCAICAIGNAEIRLNWIEKLEEAGYEISTLIHPQAYVSPLALIGKGTIIEPMAVVHANAVIEIGCIISANATVNHNAYCGDGGHIDCGAVIPAGVVVPKKTKVRIAGGFTEAKTIDSVNGKSYPLDGVM